MRRKMSHYIVELPFDESGIDGSQIDLSVRG